MAMQTRDLEGISTTVVVQPFADRVLVLVTQLGKVGNLIQATLPATTSLNPPSSPDVLPVPPGALQLTTLLGSAPSDYMRIVHSLYASQIATVVWLRESATSGTARRSVIVGLGLKPLRYRDSLEIMDSERRTFHDIMEIVQQLLQQVF